MRSVRTPEEIRARGLDLWNRQDLLRSELRGESTFPLRFPCSRPSAKDLLGDFSQWKNLYRTLREQAKKASGYGYTLLEETITLRHLGEQTVPVGVIFESANDFYRFIGRHAEHRRWRALVERLLAQEPMLKNWIEAIPLVVLENEEVWERALLVMKFLRMHPRPGIYLRQLEISGIDTKFVEHHKVFLRDLLNQTLPENNIFIHETLLRSGGFERRFGFREEEPVLRFRFLDPTLICLYHFSDLTLPLSELRDADLKATRIFVTENKINGLAFPQVTGGIVIFGLGYGITCLQNIPWLSSKEIFYWGDIDTHGFSILSKFRKHFPHTQSFLMDRQTLMSFPHLWGKEDVKQRCLHDLAGLTEDEQSLFQDLRDNKISMNLRFEQERIPFAWVKQKLIPSQVAD